jgi:predicted  nucleic acid-binding Zn-ribbon protein
MEVHTPTSVLEALAKARRDLRGELEGLVERQSGVNSELEGLVERQLGLERELEGLRKDIESRRRMLELVEATEEQLVAQAERPALEGGGLGTSAQVRG